MAGVYDIEEQKEKIETLRQKKILRDQSDLSKVLSLREGRRLIWKVLSMAGVYALSFSGMDHAQTDFNEGKRSVGNLLLKDIPPEVELAMKREAANDRLLHEQEIKEAAE